MSRRWSKFKKTLNSKSFDEFLLLALESVQEVPEIKSECNKPLEFTFVDQLKALVYYHFDGFESGRHFLQTVNESEFAKSNVALNGIKKSTFLMP